MDNRTDHLSPQRDGSQDGKSVRSDKKSAIITKIKVLWRAAGFSPHVVKMMIKSSLTGTLVLAAYQSNDFSNFYTTLGYLTTIIAALGGATRPRASFLQLLIANVFMACLATALVILAMYCCVKARQHSMTTPATGPTSGQAATGVFTAPYSSSGSAVAGVWLFVLIYGVSVVRVRKPQYTISCVIFSITVIVSLVYVPQLDTVTAGLAFSKNFLLSILTGLSFATLVSLIIFPTTCRSEVFENMESYISHIRAALEAQMSYLHSLESADMFAAQPTNTAGERPPRSAEAEAFRSKMRETRGVYSKMASNMTFAKREIAVGKLGPSDIQHVFNHLRPLLVPMTGLSYVSDLFDRVSNEHGWDRSRNMSHAAVGDADDEAERARIMSINEWHELIRRLKEPFTNVVEAIDEGLQHVAIALELSSTKLKKETKDAEKGGAGRPQPGTTEFAAHLNQTSQAFLESKKVMLRSWCALHDVQLDTDFFSDPLNKQYDLPIWMNTGSSTEEHRRVRQQLAIMLYIEYTFYYVSRRTYDLVIAVDALKASGKLSRRRIILPGLKRIRKWATEAFFREQDSQAHGLDEKPDLETVRFGSAFKKQDPEHLPPETRWERLTDRLRGVAHFFASPASHFGFRVAVATMCVAIISLLESTQIFFTRNRLFWAEIMVPIGMQPSAGIGLQIFLLRVGATVAANITSWIAWYIVDGHAAGVIVFFFLLSLPSTWFMMRWPQYATVGIVYYVTMIIIVGYELQVQKIGVTRAESNEQQYYPIYIIGPIRLAGVVVGLAIAFFFTIFPYPISEHSKLRKTLGSSLYILTRYHAIMHRIVGARLWGTVGDTNVKGSPSYQLQKMRLQLFAQCSSTITALKSQANATKLDVPIGGKFPLEIYNRLIESMENMLNYMTIMGIASANVVDLLRDRERHGLEWLQSLRRLNHEDDLATEAITALLSQLASAVITGHPLPPYLRVPERYRFAQKIEEMDHDILSIRHLAEPGYAVFAVVMIGSKCIADDLRDVLDGVRDLVGELDFSYHVSGKPVPQEDFDEDLLPKDLQNKND